MRTRRLERPLFSILRMRIGREAPVEPRWVPPQACRSRPAISTMKLGELMYFDDGETHVGTIEAVTVSPGGHEVHLDRFVPSAIPMRHRWASGKLVLVEAVAFLAEHFAAVTTIRVSMNSPVERHDDFLKIASDRAQLPHRIGAQQINIIPNLMPSNRGAAMTSACFTQRAACGEASAAACAGDYRRPLSRARPHCDSPDGHPKCSTCGHSNCSTWPPVFEALIPASS